MTVHGGNIYEYEGCLDFSANINPLGMPESVVEAAKRGVEASIHYPDVKADKLIRGIAEKEQTDPQWILCGNGAAELIFSVVRAVQPKQALLLAPTFAEYEQALVSEECKVSYYKLNEQDFQVKEDIINQISHDTDIVFLCNPNNPTGKRTKRELLLKIAEKCKECFCMLIIDECFLEFTEQEEEFTMVPYLVQFPNLFILKAFTKIYAMPGLRLGYGITSNTSLLSRMKSGMQPWNLSVPAQFAGIAALKETEYVKQTKEYIKAEREFLYQGLMKLADQAFYGEANYLFFRSEEGLKEKMIKKNILIRDCSNYEGLSKGYYRVAVRTRKENEAFLKAFSQIRGFE
ncbi:MAG: threonine-phosphate decarboxylase [Lachnospiraceae bacterium]|nr:threonine-phosphate decarboxylase [Lachnospiraceae bacterium]